MATRALATDLDARGVSRLRNIPDPVEDLEACNLRTAQQMFEQVLDLVRGLNWKDDCRVGFSYPVNPFGAPSTEGGVVLQDGDRVLLLGQDSPTQNGIYVWTDRVLARSADANNGALLQSAVVSVADGTLRGQTFRQSTRDPVVGISAIVWTPFLAGVPAATTTQAGVLRLAQTAEVAAGLIDNAAVTPLALRQAMPSLLPGSVTNGMAVTIGDGGTTDFFIDHPYQTRDLFVSARDIATGEQVSVAVTMPSNSQVRVSFLQPPAVDSFRILLLPV